MKGEQAYNGWTNWETWNLALWIGEGLIDEDTLRETVERDPEPYAVGQSVRELVEEFISETMTDPWSGLVGDMIGGYLSGVDWLELGEHYAVDYAPAVEAEDEGGES